MTRALLLLFIAEVPAAICTARAETVSVITQYGITWTFDRPHVAGQYVTGDWWVIGPVKVMSVNPAPGTSYEPGAGADVKSRYGATAMVADSRMRNGSMISPRPGRSQGYDSRLKNYDSRLSVQFPAALQSGDALVSTISNKTVPTQVMFADIMWSSEKQAALALNTAAVLTVVDAAPPVDAFRPAYSGGDHVVHCAKNLHWELLPSLPVPSGVGDVEWDAYTRYLQRPWLDHVSSWLHQNQGPGENQANYGREFSRITSIASLLLMLDAPRERKKTLLIGFVQLGIDLKGLAVNGRNWDADGGHWNGRKWPMLFAGLMLGDPDFTRQASGTVFSEDQQTYYGQGWQGATALYQIVNHTGAKPPHEETAPDAWDADNKRAESYRIVVSGGLPGTALAVQLMKAKALWNHDAFFDYYDRWMAQDDPYAAGRGGRARPKQEGGALDPMVNAMWIAYRAKIPFQSGGRDNRKWVWVNSRQGQFVPNDPAAAPR